MYASVSLALLMILFLTLLTIIGVWALVATLRAAEQIERLGRQVEALGERWRELQQELRQAIRPPGPAAPAPGIAPPVPTTPAPPPAAAGPTPVPVPPPARPAPAGPTPVPVPPAVPTPGLAAAAAAMPGIRGAAAAPPPAPGLSRPAVPAPPAPPAQEAAPPGPLAAARERFEAGAILVLRRAWNWLIVGEEFRDPARSLEYSVATTWGVRLAIALIVTGIAFGLKMSFDRGWVGPGGRVVLGVLTGIALIAAGLRVLGKRYHILGQGFVGGGLATLYVTTFAAHNLYGLMDAWTSFGFMAAVTAAAGVISVSVSSLLVAVLGIVGGYLTPFVLQGGDAGYAAFFAYLLFLGVGILIVSRFRYWVLLNYLGMALTYVHVLRTLNAHYATEHLWQVLPWLAALFCLYTAVTVLYNVVHRRPSTLIEVLGLLVNSGVFFGIAQDLIRESCGRERVAFLTVALALLYVGITYAFLQRRLQDRPLLLALLALAGFYVALTMPLVLSREWLTVSWAVQAFLMLWLGRRLGSRFLQTLSCVLYAIVVWRIFCLDLRHAFPPLRGELPLGRYLRDLADRLVAFGVPVAALLGAWRLHARPPAAAGQAVVPRESDTGPLVSDRAALAVFLAAAVAAAFVYLHCELNRLFGVAFDPFRLPALTLLWLALALGLFLAACRLRELGWLAALGWAALAVILLKLIAIDLHAWDFRPETMRFGGAYSWLQAAMRVTDFGAAALFAAWAAREVRRSGRKGAPALLTTALAILFCYLTLEVNTVVSHYVPGLRSGGISIFWSLYGLALVVGGLARAVRPARVAGLVLFGVVGLKVFFIDLDHLSPLYRMLALLAMGLITLAGTFLYLRNAERFLHAPAEENRP